MKRFATSIILMGIIVAAALMTMYSSTRVTPLIDYSYQVENAVRIYQGQMPYRDFFLVLPPGVYVIMALLMYLTQGYSHLVQLLATVIVSIVTVLLTFYLGKTYKLWTWTILLCLSLLILTGQATFPWPSYDIWATFTILLTLLLTVNLLEKKRLLFWYPVCGSLLCLPALMKQNIGILYLAGMLLILSLIAILQKDKQFVLRYLFILCGVVATIGGLLLYGSSQRALEPFLYQVFMYPRIMRDPLESITVIRGQYLATFNLILSYPLIFLGSLIILIVPSGIYMKWRSKLPRHKQAITEFWIALGSTGLITLACLGLVHSIRQEFLMKWFVQLSSISIHLLSLASVLLVYKHKNAQQQLLHLLPIPIVLAVHGAYLSHHIVSSSYGIIPLLLVLLFAILSMLRHLFRQIQLFAVLLPVIVTLMYLYGVNLQQRFLFAYVNSYGNQQTATYSRIEGLSTPGPWIPRMERMFRFVENTIPLTESVAFLPHEDPFFAVTGRNNPLPFVQYGDAVYPRSPMIFEDLITSNITWLIIKQDFQGRMLSFNIDPALYQVYQQMYQLDGYLILKRIQR